MSAGLLPAERQEKTRLFSLSSDRMFQVWLLAITLVSLVPRLILGASQFIQFDGYYDTFVAIQGRWPVWWVEVRDTGHPPLFYLLQRLFMMFGHSHLNFRASGIVPGVVSVYVMGLIARKVCTSRVVALLAAAAFGFSMVVIDLSCGVRSYALALCFVLLAFNEYASYLLDPLSQHTPRVLRRFTIFIVLAMLTEHYSIFFLAACLAAIIVIALTDSEFYRQIAQSLRRYWKSWAVVLAVPLALTAVIYYVQLRLRKGVENHVAEHYWPASGQKLADFLVTNSIKEFNYFFPLDITSASHLAVLVAIFLPLLSAFLLLRRGSVKRAAASAPVAVLLMLLGELITLALIGRYPYGGEMRHQSILIPFLLLTGFVLIDWLARAFSKPAPKYLIYGITALLIMTSFGYRWRAYPKISEELLTDQYRLFQKNFPAPSAVYADYLSCFAYFIHTREWNWAFEHRRVENGQRVFEYRTTGPSGEIRQFFRNKDVWNFDLSQPDVYKTIAQLLRGTKRTSIDLFYLKQVPATLDPAAAKERERTLSAMADHAGLRYGPSFFDGTQAFIEFRLK